MKYFTITELTASKTATAKGIDNTPTLDIKIALVQLVYNILDPLRASYGKPINVDSGYRCPQLNKVVGGKPTSQHLLGEAADINAGSRSENARLYELIKQKHLPVDQCINEYNYKWIHVSYGPRNRREFFAIG
jgi:zinc D-Ala-D-Ala carboxypeptidase